MEKLVFVYNWGDEGCSGQSVIPFEYSSKYEFNCMVCNLLETAKENKRSSIELFDMTIYFSETYEVYKLDEWFNKFNEKYING